MRVYKCRSIDTMLQITKVKKINYSYNRFANKYKAKKRNINKYLINDYHHTHELCLEILNI